MTEPIIHPHPEITPAVGGVPGGGRAVVVEADELADVAARLARATATLPSPTPTGERWPVSAQAPPAHGWGAIGDPALSEALAECVAAAEGDAARVASRLGGLADRLAAAARHYTDTDIDTAARLRAAGPDRLRGIGT